VGILFHRLSGTRLIKGKLILLAAAVLIFIAGAIVAPRLEAVHGQGQPGAGFAAVPASKGGWDLTGPYDVVRDWPKPMSQLAGHENWGCRVRKSLEEEELRTS
jgi:hypothetical protein